MRLAAVLVPLAVLAVALTAGAPAATLRNELQKAWKVQAGDARDRLGHVFVGDALGGLAGAGITEAAGTKRDIALARHLTDKNANMHAGIWDKSAKGAHEVRGRVLGIVGYGNIGSQLSVVAESLGMRVYFYDIADKLARYTPVRLTADLSKLTPKERSMLPLLIDAARTMDTIFWRQVYPARDSLLGAVSDSSLRRLIVINAGPWDGLDNDKPFVPGVATRIRAGGDDLAFRRLELSQVA